MTTLAIGSNGSDASFLSEDGMIATNALVQAIELGAATGTQLEPDSPAVGLSKHRAKLLALCHAHGYKATGIALALGLGLSTLYRHLQAAGIPLRALRNSHVFSENSRED
jgi:transcriptional regulator of acetoin/glycerol metabolism